MDREVRRRRTLGSACADLLLLAWLVFALFPIVWTVRVALTGDAEKFTLENFGTVLSRRGTDLTGVDLPGALLGSVLSCGGAVLVSLIVGIPAGYAAARWSYRGAEHLMFQLLSFRFVPELLVAVPLYVIYRQTGLFDTAYGMIWALQLLTLPVVVWVLRSYFRDLPPEVEQAALLDGYGRRRVFLMVALPLARPGIAVAALLAFVVAWNSFVFPLILTDGEAGPVTVAVVGLLGGGQAYHQLTAAAALIGVLPPVVFAVAVRRHLARGLSFGAVRG